jgi:hypothetical protein
MDPVWATASQIAQAVEDLVRLPDEAGHHERPLQMTRLGYVSVSGCRASLSLLERLAYGRDEVRARVQAFVQRMLASGSPIQSVHYLDVRQSMKNGGGPACLRLRVMLVPHTSPGSMRTTRIPKRLISMRNASV